MIDTNKEHELMDENIVKYGERIFGLRNKIVYFSLLNGCEIAAKVIGVIPSGFIIDQPARLYTYSDDDGKVKTMLLPFARFTLDREFVLTNDKIVLWGHCDKNISEFYTEKFLGSPLLSTENDNVPMPSQPLNEEQKTQLNEMDKTIEALKKEGRIIDFTGKKQ